MKKIYLTGLIIGLLPFMANAQMSGNYVIGSGGDYPTLNAAISALTSQGLSGNVVFTIKDGTYNEGMIISSPIVNAGKYSVTFQSQSNDSDKVKIISSGLVIGFSENPLNFIFKNLTLVTTNNTPVMSFFLDKKGNQQLEISGCHFIAPPNAPTMINLAGQDNQISKLTIEQCVFEGSSSYNLFVQMNNSDEFYDEAIENVTIKNTILSQGIFMSALSRIKNVLIDNISGNKIFNDAGICLYSQYDSIIHITINKVSFTSSNRGIFVSSIANVDFKVTSSHIFAFQEGLYINISNNITDVFIRETEIIAQYSAIIITSNQQIKNVVFKKVVLSMSGMWSNIVYMGANTINQMEWDSCYFDASKNNQASPNIYARYAIGSCSIKNSFFRSSTGSMFFQANNQIDGLLFENDSIINKSSLAMKINVYSGDLNNIGIYSSYINAPLSGIFFSSIKADSIHVDHVTFEDTWYPMVVYSSTTMKNIFITHSKTINSSSISLQAHTNIENVLFEADSLFSSEGAISIESSYGGLSNFSVVKSHLEYKDNRGIDMDFTEDIQKVLIANNSFIQKGSSSYNHLVMNTDGYIDATVRDNYFLKDGIGAGGNGIEIYNAKNVTIENNILEASANNVYSSFIDLGGKDNQTFNQQGTVTIKNNTLKGYSDSYFIYLAYLNGNTVIENNTINGDDNAQGNGVSIYNIKGTLDIARNNINIGNNNGETIFDIEYCSPEKGRVYNNFLSGYCSYGIYCYESNNFDFVNNTMSTSFSDSSNTAVYLDCNIFSCKNNTFMNNIFYQYGTGTAKWYGINRYETITKNTWKNNLYYRKKDSVSFAVVWGNSQQYIDSLTTWQKNYRQDSSSFSMKVPFINDTNNLHIACGTAGLDKAIPVGYVTFDIDGQPRAAKPTLGADEIITAGSTIHYASQVICGNNPVVLDAGFFAGSTYAWSNGKNTRQITVTAPGTYTVTISSGSCGTITGEIKVDPIQPLVDFTAEKTYTAVEFKNQSTGAVSYLWNFGDGQTSTEENPIHIYKSIGTYTATLTAYAECDTLSKSMVLDFRSIGLEEVLEAVSLYPNPVSNVLTLSFITPVDVIIRIFSADGHLTGLYKMDEAKETAIDMTNYPAGMYLLQIVSKDNTTTRKFVKE